MARHHTILPHKTWNVWNRDNLAKFEKDEAEESKKIEKAQQREREAQRERVYRQVLANKRGSSEYEEEKESKPTQLQHVELFDVVKIKALQNEERLEEERKAKEKEDRRNTMYLGQTFQDDPKAVPWYQKPPPKITNISDDEVVVIKKRDEDPLPRMIKNIQKEEVLTGSYNPSSSKRLPLPVMMKGRLSQWDQKPFGEISKSQGEEKATDIKDSNAAEDKDSYSDRHKRKRSEEKSKRKEKSKKDHKDDSDKHKKKKKKKEKSKTHKNKKRNSNSDDEQSRELENLRAERLKREKEEQMKAAKLILEADRNSRPQPTGYHAAYHKSYRSGFRGEQS